MDDDVQKLLLEAEQRLQKCATKPTEKSTTRHAADCAYLPNIPKLSHGTSLSPYVHQRNELAVVDSARIINHMHLDQSKFIPQKEEPRPMSKKDKSTAGADWFDLPKTELTPELKRDLQLLRMRSILDPKRHYKKENGKVQAPKYSQVGTVIEGPTEFFSARVLKRDRKKTFVEEALATEQVTRRFETKYRDIQDQKRSGKSSFYKGLQGRRNGRGTRH